MQFMPLSDAEAEISEELSPECAYIRDEKRKNVQRALEKLPDEQRTAVHLVYFENLSYEETAKIMKKSKKQVDNLLYRAKNALRSIIGEEASND